MIPPPLRVERELRRLHQTIDRLNHPWRWLLRDLARDLIAGCGTLIVLLLLVLFIGAALIDVFALAHLLSQPRP